MKVIGLLGGMSWESTSEYYKIINEQVNQRLGGLHSAKIVLYSVDFAVVEELQRRDDWTSATSLMIAGAKRIATAGADCLVICTNTMHKMAEPVAAAIEIPLLHIADATADRVKAAGVSRVGLLGTRFTMEQSFYRGRLEERHGLDVITPNDVDKSTVHRIIYDELCKGVILDDSRSSYLEILNRLVAEGCEAVILGCTEIGMLIRKEFSDVALFDTTRIHAEAAVDFALESTT